MKLLGAILLLALFAVPARADELIDYTLSVVNAPGVGSFSWEIQTDGFITTPPDPVYQCIEYCNESSEHWIRECVEYCDTVYYSDFVSVSEPSTGEGCAISKVWLQPNYAPSTLFSPVCDGQYDDYVGGAMPEPGTFGTWSWSWGSGADETFETLTVSDPPAMPEPSSLALLGLGVLGLAVLRYNAFALRGFTGCSHD